MGKVVAVKGDLTLQEVSVIVNAASEALLGGGGVDGAVHRAAGPALLEACRRLPEVSPGVRCPAGSARITPGFALPAAYVIHTVGPVYTRDPRPEATLRSAHNQVFSLARAHQLRTIALPAISCGVFGYPLAAAAAIAVDEAVAHSPYFDEIRFVLFGGAALRAWQEVLS